MAWQGVLTSEFGVLGLGSLQNKFPTMHLGTEIETAQRTIIHEIVTKNQVAQACRTSLACEVKQQSLLNGESESGRQTTHGKHSRVKGTLMARMHSGLLAFKNTDMHTLSQIQPHRANQ